MKDFIQAWKAEHRYIAESLMGLRGVANDPHQCQRQLQEVKERLLSHLKTEDEILYPAFREKAKEDLRAQCIVDLFEQDMANISREVLRFFEKYECIGDMGDFLKDLDVIIASLEKRIWNEENVLMDEYQRISQES